MRMDDEHSSAPLYYFFRANRLDYGASQYNRITQAFRQPGSIFKPLVYAAAIEASQEEAGKSKPAPPEISSRPR